MENKLREVLSEYVRSMLGNGGKEEINIDSIPTLKKFFITFLSKLEKFLTLM
jgi:hypothetical protein